MNYDVLVVSTHDGFRESTRMVLGSFGDFPQDKICEARSGEEAVRTIDDTVANGGGIGVILADYELPREEECLALLMYVTIRHPSIPVVVTSVLASSHEELAAKLMQLGAYAHFQKDAPIEVLMGLVRSALAKHTEYDSK